MNMIVKAVLILAASGLLVGIMLVAAQQLLKMKVDPRIDKVRSALPGNNCGACGYAGCDAMASAIVSGNAPANGCPICNDEAYEEIARIMGQASESVEHVRAVVKCSGGCEHTDKRANYVGVQDCRAAVMAGLVTGSCTYGCLGLGSCVRDCPFDAIRIRKGVAAVDPELCRGCRKCVSACPQDLIEMIPVKQRVTVRCSSKDRGAVVRKTCTAGCIGCKLCANMCEFDAICVENNVAHIDGHKCTGCRKCVDKCPVRCIHIE